jgi:hypothetical protein
MEVLHAHLGKDEGGEGTDPAAADEVDWKV